MTRRAALVVIHRAGASERTQWAQMLTYAEDTHLNVVALIRWAPSVAVDLVRAGHADVVVAVSPAAGLDRIRDIEVEFVRPPVQPIPRVMIRQMLHRGGDADVIAQLLDVPIDVILDIQTQILAQAHAHAIPTDALAGAL